MKKKDQVTAAEEQKEAVQVKGKKRRAREAQREIRWDRLDNTAHLFPVIAGESMSNVYRISVTLKEEINPELLQRALDMVLPKFDGFNLRLRQGVFWYYFEENGKAAPKVRMENNFPCRYIQQNKNRSYMFRVTYYKCRINLEVFHVLTDGMGGINFLKELTYQYLRLAHKDLQEKLGDSLSVDTSLNREDSFLKNYKKSSAKGYQTKKAYLIRGEKLRPGEFGVMHGYMKIPELKRVCHAMGISINEYLVSVYIWSVYTECLHGMPSKCPIRVAVPVNLRPYFNSITTKNFFVMVSAEFHPTKETYTFAEVAAIVKESLRSQINKEHLEEIFSYNVSNQKNILLRSVPIFIKAIAMRLVYISSARASTSTITNLGKIAIDEKYQKYIAHFTAMISRSAGQIMKGAVCSYQDVLSFTFTSALKDLSVERCFFRTLAKDGIKVAVETNLE
mgnify:CR=1 FL=1